MRCEVLTAVNVRITVVGYEVTKWGRTVQTFGGTCCSCIPDDLNPSDTYGLYHFAATTLLFCLLSECRVSYIDYIAEEAGS